MLGWGRTILYSSKENLISVTSVVNILYSDKEDGIYGSDRILVEISEAIFFSMQMFIILLQLLYDNSIKILI
jgi:hypothetical protein